MNRPGFSVLIADLAASAALMKAINDLNKRYVYGKFMWTGMSVVMGVDVPGRPFVGAHVEQAIGMVGSVADELDEELQKQFGGRTAFGERLLPPEDVHMAGYL